MPDMRFAPPPAVRVIDRGGGLNQMSVRTYNERLVISLLRRHDSLSRMDLGQHSGLSAQTISVIVRSLERDQLILPGEAQRGRVGPPSTPMFLNPDGAFAMGINIGAKSTDTVLIDFIGAVRQYREHAYAYPDPRQVLAGLADSIAEMKAYLPDEMTGRLVGVGVSLPGDIEHWPRAEWHAAIGERWRDVDFERQISARSGLSTYIQNDVTAAAGAEGTFGAARTLNDFVYFYIGAQSASRLILNHHIYAGRRPAGALAQVARLTTLSDLETLLQAQGIDAAPIRRSVESWPDFGPSFTQWINTCARSVARAFLSAGSFVDVDCAIIDGRLPFSVRERLCAAVVDLLAPGENGEPAPKILAGKVGFFAKAVGAASLPFHSRFMVEHVGLAPS
jgi:predicted NBD/HSP70 family sugar kinase